MNKLLSTTAVIVAMALPSLSLAQTQAPVGDAAQEQSNGMSGFLDQRDQSDLYASELIGHSVYARSTPAEMNTENTGTNGMMMTNADLDGMENIGEINEIVLSNDGKVRALVIGVGGFLGMGEQDVAITMDQISFASNADDRSEMYIIVNTDMDMLRSSPAYDRTARMDGQMQDGDAARMDGRSAFAAPNVERDGYSRVEVTEVSTELLTGKSVYDINDNDVGTVTDMILDDKGAITEVIIDFGGFLGIGSSQASLNYDELTILSDEGYADVRLYVDATKEQIQDLPQYNAAN